MKNEVISNVCHVIMLALLYTCVSHAGLAGEVEEKGGGQDTCQERRKIRIIRYMWFPEPQYFNIFQINNAVFCMVNCHHVSHIYI